MDGLYDYLLCTKCHFLKRTVITDFALLVRFEQLGDRGRSHCHVHQPPCLLLLHRSLSWVLITQYWSTRQASASPESNSRPLYRAGTPQQASGAVPRGGEGAGKDVGEVAPTAAPPSTPSTEKGEVSRLARQVYASVELPKVAWSQPSVSHTDDEDGNASCDEGGGGAFAFPFLKPSSTCSNSSHRLPMVSVRI